MHAAAARRLAALPLGFVSPIVLTGRDLRSVPTERDAPHRQLRAGSRPTLRDESLPASPVRCQISSSAMRLVLTAGTGSKGGAAGWYVRPRRERCYSAGPTHSR